MKDEKESKFSRETAAAVLDSQQFADSLNKQGIISIKDVSTLNDKISD